MSKDTPGNNWPEDCVGEVHALATLDSLKIAYKKSGNALPFRDWLREACAKKGVTELSGEVVGELASVLGAPIRRAMTWANTAEANKQPVRISALFSVSARDLPAHLRTPEDWYDLADDAAVQAAIGSPAFLDVASFARETRIAIREGRIPAEQMPAVFRQLWTLIQEAKSDTSPQAI